MSIIIEESDEIPCYSCVQMRKIFLLVAVSSLLPMILFMALLLLLSARKPQLEDSTSTIVEFVFGLLYLHLFVATFMMLASYLKRRSPVRYQCVYLLFHAVCMLLFFISSLLLTIINQSYALAMCLVVLCALYVCFLCYFMKINNIALFAISRAF
ncbi:unnamed protein product [Pieris macdunnoughi]|uniref:Uncharacterized protein n=1 Tax=Pieris macdunnoughi TaxID=345717 RepID=A0A821SV69_9NEOP|nr:unnamed protein product [Pieris macdunnoughi]